MPAQLIVYSLAESRRNHAFSLVLAPSSVRQRHTRCSPRFACFFARVVGEIFARRSFRPCNFACISRDSLLYSSSLIFLQRHPGADGQFHYSNATGANINTQVSPFSAVSSPPPQISSSRLTLAACLPSAPSILPCQNSSIISAAASTLWKQPASS